MDVDVSIVGAGPVGLCFARSLAQFGLRVTLIEQQTQAQLADPACYGREIAVTHASRRILDGLGVWSRIPDEDVAPLRDAHVFNGKSKFALRIEHGSDDNSSLGFLVPNHLIRKAAFEAARDSAQITLLTGHKVESVTTDAHGASARLDDAREVHASLPVAADTRFSQTRRAMGIPAAMHDFGRTMLVCRMTHTVPHDEIAWEWFDHGQTLAVLPLRGNASSIVITLPNREVDTLLAMTDEVFGAQVAKRFGNRLGTMSLVGTRHAYPLVAVYPRRFVAQRFALVGDAAVGMHPVTAHGFNFGLAGQRRLAQAIGRASNAQSDIGAPAILEAYERSHRRATRPLYSATNGIARLFVGESLPARFVRHNALRFAQRVTPVRRMIAAVLADRGRATS